MPTGFRVETGSALSQKLLPLAPRLSAMLKRMRDSGAATPLRPITAGRIKEHMAAAGFRMHNSEICAMVNHLRRAGNPIASNGDGYFWANTRDELEPTIQHMRERIASMSDALGGMTRRFYSGQRELPLNT